MPRSDTMTPQGTRRYAAIASLLVMTGATLAFIAGDTVKTTHDYPAGIGMGALALTLLGAGVALVAPAVRRRGRSAGWLPPIEPTPLPDDLYDAATDLADAFLGLDRFDASDLQVAHADALDAIPDGRAARIAALHNTINALKAAERYSPNTQTTYGELAAVCSPAADAYVATLASDLIAPYAWQALTRFYREQELRPCLPVQVATRFNTPSGGRS